MAFSLSHSYLRIFRISLFALVTAFLPAHSADSEQKTSPEPTALAPATNAPIEMAPSITGTTVPSSTAPSTNAAPPSVDSVLKASSEPVMSMPATNAPAETAPSISGTSVPSSTGATPTPTSASAPAEASDKSPAPKKFTYSSVHVDGPYIAMTFDDGPNPKNTPKLLDLLAAKHIHATFFVVGENAVRMPDILKRIIAEGHEIGNHSWDHPNFGKSSDDKIRSQVQRTHDAILTETGVKPVLLRPPYGSMTPRQRQWVHDEFGYNIILWDVDPNDWKEPGVSVVAERIISGTRPGSIILSHDIHAPTIEAMPAVFDALLAKGYKFVTVSELLAMDKGPSKTAPAPPEPSPTTPEASYPKNATNAPIISPTASTNVPVEPAPVRPTSP